MAAAPTVGLSVWTDTAAAGTLGTAAADVVAWGDDASLTERLTNDDVLTFGLPADDPSVAELADRRVVRIAYADGTCREMRIAQIDASTGAGGGRVRVTARGMIEDLADAGPISTTSASGVVSYAVSLTQATVAEVIDDYVLPHMEAAGYVDGSGATYFARGTVDSTARYDWSWSCATPLAVLTMIAQRLDLELSVRPDSATAPGAYEIHLEAERGAGAGAAYVEAGKNLVALARSLRGRTRGNAILVRGSGGDEFGTIAHAAWRVTATDAVNVTADFEDPEGVVGPFTEDDQANTWYVRPDGGGALVQVQDSWRLSATAGRVQLASLPAAITVGALFEFRAGASGEALTLLESPAQLAAAGGQRKVQVVDRATISGARNLIAVNPWMRTYTTSPGAPDGWATSGGITPSRDTTHARYGPNGARFQVAAFAPAATGTLTTTAFPTVIPAGDSRVSARLSCSANAGHQGATVTLSLRFGLTVIGTTTATIAAASAIRYEEVTLEGVDLAPYSGSNVFLQVDVASDGTNLVDVTIDAAAVSFGTSAPPQVEYSEAVQLWGIAAAQLAELGGPVPTYEIDARDLTRADASIATGWPDDEFTLGATITLVDPVLDVSAALRVVEMVASLRHPARTKLTLSTRPRRLSREIAG